MATKGRGDEAGGVKIGAVQASSPESIRGINFFPGQLGPLTGMRCSAPVGSGGAPGVFIDLAKLGGAFALRSGVLRRIEMALGRARIGTRPQLVDEALGGRDIGTGYRRCACYGNSHKQRDRDQSANCARIEPPR